MVDTKDMNPALVAEIELIQQEMRAMGDIQLGLVGMEVSMRGLAQGDNPDPRLVLLALLIGDEISRRQEAERALARDLADLELGLVQPTHRTKETLN